MKAILKQALILISLIAFIAPTTKASGAGTSAGLTLAETTAARPASLGEAYSAMGDDISAFGYNPASLGSLKSGQSSFMYQKGLAEDAYGHFAVGMPTKNGAFGLSFGYYNGGTMELFDGTNTNTVTSQKDMSLSLGMARNVGSASFGFTGKYLSSELVETYKATAYAADFGMQMPLNEKMRLGFSAQNIGTKLTYLSEGDSLPMIVRGGMSMNMLHSSMLLLDLPYYKNEGEIRPAVGLETNIGPLALRAGYRKGNSLNEFSFGTGFTLGRSSLDYSFGLVRDLQSEHKVSFSMKFGGDIDRNMDFAKKIKVQEIQVAKKIEKKEIKNDEKTVAQGPRHSLGELKTAKSGTMLTAARRVYVVQSGDTLGRIARRVYGDSGEWKRIYVANRHLLGDDTTLSAGQKIVLP